MAASPPSSAVTSARVQPGDDEIIYLGFNQDHGCFACGTDVGFRVYNSDPFQLTFARDFGGGIAVAQMLFRCNIQALVGGGPSPQFPPNKVMIWDDHQARMIGELAFRSRVRGLQLRRDRIAVALEHKAYVYNFADLKLLHSVETISNPRGLLALSPGATSTVLACPGLHRGQVRVELYDLRRTKFVPAHESHLACLAVSDDGSRLATASEKGTLIRVFDTADGRQLHELRRGSDKADIHCLSFNRTGELLAVGSDHGTVHVFSVGSSGGDGGASSSATRERAVSSPGGGGGGDDGGAGAGADSNRHNVPSVLAPLRALLPDWRLTRGVRNYASTEWAFARFRIPDAAFGGSGGGDGRMVVEEEEGEGGGEGVARRHGSVSRASGGGGVPRAGLRVAVGFSQQVPNALCVATSAGGYYVCSFDLARGGECEMTFHKYFGQATRG